MLPTHDIVGDTTPLPPLDLPAPAGNGDDQSTGPQPPPDDDDDDDDDDEPEAPEPAAPYVPPPPPPPNDDGTPGDDGAAEPDADGAGYTLAPSAPVSQPELSAGGVGDPMHQAAAAAKLLPARQVDARPSPKPPLRWQTAARSVVTGVAATAPPTATAGAPAGPASAWAADFSLPLALTAAEYVALSDEVVDVSRLLFAPLGVARAWSALPAAGLGDSGSDGPYSVEELREPWARTMDAVRPHPQLARHASD